MHCKRRRSLTIIMLNYQLSAKVCLCVKPRPVLVGLWCSTTEGRPAKSTRSLWRSCPGSGLGWWVPWLMWIQGVGLGISFIRWTIAPKVDCSASHSVCDQLFLMRSDKIGPPYRKRKTSGGSKGWWCPDNNLNLCHRFPTFAMFKVGGGMEVWLVVWPNFCFLDCYGRLYLFFAGPLRKAWTSGGRHICKVCFFFFDISEEKGKISKCLHSPGWPTKLTRWKLWQGKTSQIFSGGNIFLFAINHGIFANLTNSDYDYCNFLLQQ